MSKKVQKNKRKQLTVFTFYDNIVNCIDTSSVLKKRRFANGVKRLYS